MGNAGTRIRLAIVFTLAVPQALIGVWAVLRPEHWFEHFPGIDPRLVAAHPPFNEHLAADAGSGFLATGVTLLVAAVVGHVIAIRIALLAYALLAVPHLAYHAANPAAALSGGEDLLNLGVLASGPVLAAIYAWQAGMDDRSHQGERHDDHDQEAPHRIDRGGERRDPLERAGHRLT